MKGFTKLALASAIAAVPMAGFSMEALEDEALSAVTGQDGITITMGAVSMGGIRIGDDDAFTGSLVGGVASTNGAIFISGFSMSGSTTVLIDADSDTIQAAVTLGSGTINLGAISPTTTAAVAGSTTVISLGTLNHGDISLNVQLGAEDQGNMIAMTGIITGGINITGFTITDGGGTFTGGAIRTDLTVVDAAGGGNLTLTGTVIDVTADGMRIDGIPNVNVGLNNLILGESTDADLGDISILNLNLPTITISGH